MKVWEILKEELDDILKLVLYGSQLQRALWEGLEDRGYMEDWVIAQQSIEQCGSDDKAGNQWPEIPTCWALT